MVVRARPAAHRQGSACLLGRSSSRSSSTGNAVSSPTPADRSVLNWPALERHPPPSDHPPSARPAPAMTARLQAGLRAADRPGWAFGPGQDGTIVPRQAAVPSGEEENKGIRAVAGGPLPALNPVKSACTHQGEVSRMLLMNDGPLTVPSASSGGTRPGDPARSGRRVPAEGRQGSVAGLMVAAVAFSPQITRRLRPVPAAHPIRRQRRAGEPGAAVHRSEQASRMSRNRQEPRPGGGAGRTRR